MTAPSADDRPTPEEFAAFDAALATLRGDGAAGGHVYLSTACYHGEHGYCAAMTGWQGEKRPGQCKFCEARCVCAECDHGGAPATPASAGEPKATNEGG